ncbi:MAG: sodium-dependent bicarbonate transport family permease [Nitriliruptoraceae bacterium]
MTLTLLLDNLLSAPVIAFVVAVIATLARFDLRLPDALPSILSAYLLFAIGLKGGRSLSESTFTDLIFPIIIAVAIGIVTPLAAWAMMRTFVKLSNVDAAGIAAHYGSVSAVTFVVVLATLDAQNMFYEGFVAGLLAILEVVGIVVGLSLARNRGSNLKKVLLEVTRGPSIALLLGGIVIGAAVGDARLAATDPLFVGLFTGALTLFLLEMGRLAGERLRDVVSAGWRLIAAAILLSIINGTIGAALSALSGLSTGGIAIMATLAASASYIAAPAAVRIALPEANPALSITTALGVTFPFNITLGIPLYIALAGWFS